ncbi:MAG: ATP-binding cassette domain-containing protein [Solirubrobacteraceae bacterium]|nr:ATP-binding cassette domain-containing protein [Solirubrobacteraceae bacterium]
MLELDGLTRRYGDRVAVDDVRFAVAAGQIMGFVGPNGAGKTTTMRMVLGVLAPDAGEVRFDGRPLTRQLRAQFGYMPEERGLYAKMRVADHLAYLAELHGMSRASAQQSVAAWLTRLGIAERAEDRVESLSLGNQQRVQLGAALVHDPIALVLDEPFSGLDPIGVDVMSGVLREQAARGVPVVFSSHQLDLVERLCDAVTIIADGRIVASGTVDELRGADRGATWRVEADAPSEQWLPRIAGIEVLDQDRTGVLIRLVDGTDPQDLLDAAREAGPVRRFAPEEPSLSELFREVAA